MTKYLRNRVISKKEHDRFGHNTIASEIFEIIQDVEPPVNIGIFGKWGTGKSSVVDILENEHLNQNDNYSFIKVNVWKYDSEISLRRKFIYEFAQKLGFPEKIKGLYEKEVLGLDRLLLDELKEKLKESIRAHTIKGFILKFFLIFAIVLFILFVIAKETGLWNSVLNIVSITTLVAVLGGAYVFFTDFFKILSSSKSVVEKKPFESEEQFENEFIKIIDESAEYREIKKIIFIDDLDRCASEKVIKTLEVIKTFLEIRNCYFIIACDPEVIKKAVIDSNRSLRYTEKDGTYYLEKFFHHMIYIHPIIPGNMRVYISDLIEFEKLTILKEEKVKESLDDIIYLLAYHDVLNPRKIISLFNSFILEYNLAKDKEDEDERLKRSKGIFLPKGMLTSKPEIIAILIVLKNDFPYLYEDIKSYPRIISRIINREWDEIFDELIICKYDIKKRIDKLNNDITDEFKEKISKLPDELEIKTLIEYLELIEPWINEDLTPFIYFNADRTALSFNGNFEEYINLTKNIRNGSYEKIIEKIDGIKET